MGARVAITVVESISSAMPLAILARIFAVAGAMANTSARWARAICSTSQGVSRRNISVTTGCLESVSRVRGVRNSWAWRVMMQ